MLLVEWLLQNMNSVSGVSQSIPEDKEDKPGKEVIVKFSTSFPD
jgi:hypothetical protein